MASECDAASGQVTADKLERPVKPAWRDAPFGRFIVAWMREPLVHFALIGVVLYATLSDSGPGTVTSSRDIIVSEARLGQMTDQFHKMWQRAPQSAELDALVEEFVREEIFYREARAMGLDEDDTIVRRRLRQKLEFLLGDMAAMRPPTDEELASFVAENASTYERPACISFRQVVLAPGRDPLQTKAALAAGADPGSLNSATLLPTAFSEIPLTRLAADMGDGFARSVAGLPVGTWTGPVKSAYGDHLVYVTSVEPPSLPPLATIRDRAVADWTVQKRRAALEAYYRGLRGMYQVHRGATNGAAAR